MSDITCAKCSEPWDSYGVRNGDMEPEDAARFLRGEGCPSCGFGGRCPSCDGAGREARYLVPRCSTCSDKGYVAAWSPRINNRGFTAKNFYYDYAPNIKELRDQGPSVTLGTRTLPEYAGKHESRDGWIDDWWVACPAGCAAREASLPCSTCSGTGKLTVEDPDDVATRAARSELDASDEEPIGILVRRNLL